MSDHNAPADDETSEDFMPQGEALARAQEELDALPPGPREPLHFGSEGVPTQTDEQPISDLLGRSDGP